MATDLLWAVTDGPAGHAPVQLPDKRLAAIALREAHRNRFWCSTSARGCGGGLRLHAGPKVRPYFQHRGQQTCRFLGDGASAAPSYEHLLYQRAFQEWLGAQGYDARLEVVLGPERERRTDLHVVVDQVRHAIEIQLSPLPAATWRARDDGYRREVDRVTWFYGLAAEAGAATELASRGVVLTLRAGPEIGVRDVDDQTHWSSLTDCSLTAGGFVAPGLREALDLREQRAAEERERHRLQAEADERAAQDRDRRQRDADAARQAARAAAEAARQATSFHLGPAVPEAAAEEGLVGFEQWQARNPEATWWQPRCGWGWLDALPVRTHRAGRALAYYTGVLVFAGTTQLSFRELVDDDLRRQLFDALEAAGLLERYRHAAGIERWERR